MKDYAPGIKSSDLTLADMPAPAQPAPKPAPASAELPSLQFAPAHEESTPGIVPAPSPIEPTATHSSPVAAESAAAIAPDPVPSAAAPSQSSAVNGDEFLAEAEREYAAGYVDKPLWARALALSGGDGAAAMPAYLRARATAIRVAKRAKRREKSLRRGHAVDGATEASIVAGAHAQTGTSEPPSPRLGIARLNRKQLTWVAGVAGIVLVASAVVIIQFAGDATQQQTAAIPAARASVPSTRAGAATTASRSSAAQGRIDVPTEDFAGKVQALKDAGNWNVLVLYGVEWTRKQPASPEAWRTLSLGYVKLRQLGEALDAATKAVELAPGDFLNWQNLGQVNVTLQRTAEAHAAFEQAATLNDRDVVSLVQAGMLDAQLGRVADARSAFDKALAVNPKDVDALCGATLVAQKEGRIKDAEAIAAQLKSIDGQCRGANTVESVRVVISSTPKTKAVLSAGR